MKNLITYFSQRHLLSNVIFLGTLILGLFVWHSIGKEELPEFSSNWIRVRTNYSGAPAEDVELFVTKPMENELKGVVGIKEIRSTSSVSVSNLRIILDDNYPDKQEVVREIREAILRVDLPDEVRNLPKIRQFKSSEKAILDIGIYHNKKHFLDQESRSELQKYILSFESQLLALNEVSSVSKSHYRKPELQILVDPIKKQRQRISLSEIKNQIQDNNVRVPVGSMHDRDESKVTALNELEDVKSLEGLILRGNYEGQKIRLGDLSNIKQGFERSTSIFKINGHEAVFLNIKKSISTDILTAHQAVKEAIEKFRHANSAAPISILELDDESYAVRNRLKIISTNGLLGFSLIVLILFLFLNVKTGFWVALGIPFTMSFTLIIANFVGYTVNNMTLAGIIIVLGIVVDDAIIIAENISRKKEQGLSLKDAAIIGTLEVFKPIMASVITTCVAFIPLFFFEGFFGKLVTYIPLIVILMLLGSLIESLFILPAHLSTDYKFLSRFAVKKTKQNKNWFKKYEDGYKYLLLKVFKFRIPVLLAFIILLVVAGILFKTQMKFVMFPREESKEVIIKVKAKKGTVRAETARMILPLEEMFVKDKVNVVGVRSSVALSRRGGEVKENEASILVELTPVDERSLSLKKLLKKWKKYADTLEGFELIKFIKGRWGHDSGSAIEIQIQENDDSKRSEIAKMISDYMKRITALSDVEIEDPLTKKEYLFKLKQDQLIKFDVAPAKVTSSLRSFVEGSILYSINKGDEEVDVRLSVPDSVKTDLLELLNLRVENKQGQLIYLKKIVEIKEVVRPVNIKRNNYKRATMVYADFKDGADKTPLEIAEDMERELFPQLTNKCPTAILKFRGEVEDTRESQGEFRNSILIVIILIYAVLVVMFNSLLKPLLILLVVPFGLAGCALILMAHSMSVYGFFAVIGALGMIGVVVNDAIIMIDRIDQKTAIGESFSYKAIAEVAASRFRPILLTTMTTVVGILPTAYGIAGHDSMLSEMMLAMGWGLAFGTLITLFLIPSLYTFLPHKK